MKNIVKTDILIIGGGIAGLWLLNLLKKSGFSVVLLESDALGAGQTGKSQGIIHGGLKYALQGLLTPAAKAITDMPAVWKRCLSGHGEINLSQVPILSSTQYLWSTASFRSKLASFVAGMALHSHANRLQKTEFPDVFKHPDFNGQVTALDEIIIDVHALIRELAAPHLDNIFKINYTKNTPIDAQITIFTAGSGNNLLADQVKMQRRPLHMVIVKHDYDLPVYAHCLGASNIPRITITTHKAHDGKTVWYLGGQIAEEGVKLNSDEQIKAAKTELQNLFSWIDFSNASFASFFVDRAEPFQKNGGKPDTCFMQVLENTIVAWPTKLVLAPLLAHEVITYLNNANIKPKDYDLSGLNDCEKPCIATPIWDQML
jgi:hypothetical protein